MNGGARIRYYECPICYKCQGEIATNVIAIAYYESPTILYLSCYKGVFDKSIEVMTIDRSRGTTCLPVGHDEPLADGEVVPVVYDDVGVGLRVRDDVIQAVHLVGADGLPLVRALLYNTTDCKTKFIYEFLH